MNDGPFAGKSSLILKIDALNPEIKAGKLIRSITMFFLAFCMLYPFLWMLAASLTEEKQIFNFPFKLIPDPINTFGYFDVWTRSSIGIPMTVFFFNSLKVTVIGLAGSIVSSSLAAYGYSKIKFPGRDKIFMLKLSTMMIPIQVTMLPTFVIYKNLGLIDKHAALYIGTFFGATFGTFLLRQYFNTIPIEYNESAEIDGANNFKIYWKIILPLSKPILATLVIFNFTSLWNNYETPLLYLRSPELLTLPIALRFLSQDPHNIQYAGVMAGSVSAAIPVIIILIACQKYFMGGLNSAGIKG